MKETTFSKGTTFVLAGMETQWDEDGGRILLGVNIGGEAVMQRPMRVQGLGVWGVTGLPCWYTYSWTHVQGCSVQSCKIRLAPEITVHNCLAYVRERVYWEKVEGWN